MKKLLKTLAVVALIAALAGGVWIGANWRHVRAFPKILSSWYAKEFCSCYFVVGRDEAFCHNIARQWVPVDTDSDAFVLDTESGTVTVRGLGHSHTARYQGQRFGCVLESR